MNKQTNWYYAVNGVNTSEEFPSRIDAIKYKKLHIDELKELLTDATQTVEVHEQAKARLECIKASTLSSITFEVHKPTRKSIAIEKKYSAKIAECLADKTLTKNVFWEKMDGIKAEYANELEKRGVRI